MTLSSTEVTQLRDALLDAYTVRTLEQMLFYQLDRDLESISLGGNFREVVFDLIRQSLKEGWTDRLVHAAHDANPGNVKLKAFTDQYLRFKGSSGALERIIHKTNGFIDVGAWRTKLARIERQVCSIEIQGEHAGTGFLIGPDRVMTNYHVVENLLGDSPGVTPDAVRIRFDFKKSDDGNVVNDGVRYALAADWKMAASPYSEADGKTDGSLPAKDELDFAVLKVAPADGSDGRAYLPGKAPVLGTTDKERGWIEVPAASYEFKAGLPLFIVQHPVGRPLKMALDTNGIQSVNANGTRVRYTTNTEPGSSGSPCFDSNWNLIALHHFGDTNWKNPEWNQGIPIAAIAGQLEHVAGSPRSSAGPAPTPPAPHSIDDEVDDLLDL